MLDNSVRHRSTSAFDSRSRAQHRFSPRDVDDLPRTEVVFADVALEQSRIGRARKGGRHARGAHGFERPGRDEVQADVVDPALGVDVGEHDHTSSSAVKTFVIEPSSNNVSPFSARGLSFEKLPRLTTRLPPASTNPTTMP
jgi:hypothetical protein